MDYSQLNRLEGVIERLLDKNRQLCVECSELRNEKLSWQQDRQRLLDEIDKILSRLDDLQLEEP